MGNDTLQPETSKTLPIILYVDDQSSHRALFQKAFQSKYQILTASSGEEGLKLAKTRNIFLVIADHNMPGMSGVDFLQKSESLLPNAQRAILSAYLDDGIVREATRRVKLTAQLAKPWKLDVLRGFIEKAYEQYITPSVPPADVPSEVMTERIAPTSYELSHVNEMLGEAVDRQGVRRIFLSFVEPKLKEHFPTIRRPYPALLQKAQEEALKGNFEGVQKNLADYLKVEGIETLFPRFGSLPKRKLQ